MRRIPFISSFLVAVVLAGCSSLHLNVRGAGESAWTTEGDSPARRNAVDADLQPPLRELWRFDAGAGFGSISPLMVDHVVFVANRKGEVHAVDLERGKRLGQTSFGETIEGTPVFDNGTIYVPVGWGRSAIFAYDVLRGARKWKVKGAPISTGLILFDGHLIAADDHGRVTAYAMETGKIDWTLEIGDQVGVKSTPALVGDRLFVADDAGHVSAIDARDGSLVWSADTGFPAYASLAADEEYLFVPTTRGRFIALAIDDGREVWSYDAGDDQVQFGAAAVGDREIVFGGSDGLVRSLSRGDGGTLWTTEAHAAVSATPLITESTVYVGTMKSRLLALTRHDGVVSWDTELDGRIKSAFAMKDGRLIVLAEPRTVYAFEREVESYAVQEE